MALTETLPARTALPPLYEVETDLVAYFDQEDSVSPELEAEFRADLARQLALAVKKRDAVASFIVEVEARAKFAAEEIQRLQRRKNVFTNWADRLRAYVCSIIEELPRDAKGKPAKLNGERFSMSARAVPASLEITDAELVPLTYKTVTVTMPAVAYEVLKTTMAIERHVDGGDGDFDFAKLPAHYSIDNARVKAALTNGVKCSLCEGKGKCVSMDVSAPGESVCPQCAGAGKVYSVAGADLRVGGLALVVR